MLELARACDRQDVERLAAQVHQTHVQWRPDIYQPSKALFPQEHFQALVSRRELYVAKLGGQVVGYAQIVMREIRGVGLQNRKIMGISQICVDEPLRNQGIGRQIVEELRILAGAFGCTDLQLNVYPQNDAAVSFYQKCGFAIQTIQMQRKV